MPKSHDLGASASGDDVPSLTLWERIKYTMVKPDDETGPKKAVADDRPVEELEELIAVCDDRERAVGLIAAPVAALITFIIVDAQVHHDPTNQSEYHTLELVLLGMALLILVSAWLRRRVFMGITMALFGVGVFNLKFWEFGFPFVFAGAWYLVRAYRLQSELRRSEAAGNYESPPVKGPSPPGSRNGAKARPSKRYTPPR